MAARHFLGTVASARRKSLLAGVVYFAVICCLTFAVPQASAAPYPPIPPTNAVLVPAAAQVPAPALDPVQIAPGSFPVQARTGAPSRSESGPSVLVPAGVAVLLIVTLLLRLATLRRVRSRSVRV